MIFGKIQISTLSTGASETTGVEWTQAHSFRKAFQVILMDDHLGKLCENTPPLYISPVPFYRQLPSLTAVSTCLLLTASHF